MDGKNLKDWVIRSQASKYDVCLYIIQTNKTVYEEGSEGGCSLVDNDSLVSLNLLKGHPVPT